MIQTDLPSQKAQCSIDALFNSPTHDTTALGPSEHPWLQFSEPLSQLRCLIRLHGDDFAILIELDLFHLDTSEVVNALAQLTVVVKQPPSTVELDNGVVGSPPEDGF